MLGSLNSVAFGGDIAHNLCNSLDLQMEEPQMQWSSTSRLNGASSYWRNNTASYSQRLSRPPSLHQEENENVKKNESFIFS